MQTLINSHTRVEVFFLREVKYFICDVFYNVHMMVIYDTLILILIEPSFPSLYIRDQLKVKLKNTLFSDLHKSDLYIYVVWEHNGYQIASSRAKNTVKPAE